MTMARPAYSITTSKPGSDLAGETAAALAAASILFKTADAAYSENLLTHAKQLFDFADQVHQINLWLAVARDGGNNYCHL